MWHSMFHLSLPVTEKVLRSLLVYVFLGIALRLAGKRELAQLNSLDFVVLLAVANAVQNGIIGDDNTVTGGMIGATTFFVVNGAMAALLFRNQRARRLIEGSPSVLVDNGALVHAALRRERLTEDDLAIAIGKQGVSDLEDVERAILEPNGSIVTVAKRPDRDEQRFSELMAEISELKALLHRTIGDQGVESA